MKKAITEGYSSYLNSRGCAGIVTWTKWAKSGFLVDGVEPGKVSVIPPPFEPIYDRRGHDGCNILFLGRDFMRKGGDTMLRAFSSVDTPGCKLHYVGRVDSDARRKVAADGRITYYGRPTNRTLSEDVWPLVDIFALPTRADAFAMTVAEAMSRAIPVVATSLPSISEAVEDGVSGFLAPVGDEAKFQDKLSKLAGDPKLRSKMGHNARERVKTLFSPAVLGGRLMEVYRRA